jgi:hypothetical protein
VAYPPPPADRRIRLGWGMRFPQCPRGSGPARLLPGRFAQRSEGSASRSFPRFPDCPRSRWRRHICRSPGFPGPCWLFARGRSAEPRRRCVRACRGINRRRGAPAECHPPRHRSAVGLAGLLYIPRAAAPGKSRYPPWRRSDCRCRSRRPAAGRSPRSDTTRPICGNAAQRAHGMISADGPKNIALGPSAIVPAPLSPPLRGPHQQVTNGRGGPAAARARCGRHGHSHSRQSHAAWCDRRLGYPGRSAEPWRQTCRPRP